ncbi:MAG: type II toxin-antitoxin system RelE/ParE family toxin [Deltaproteobacteria bacterium]|jgi:plasmid stabilization system protein ParE|nr:type II toxin-antitoxin system RelE/ParE family toxin [Deltaproteobacteria bacterium]
MGHKVVWSPEAVDDLESIAEYIARDSRYYAGAVVEKVLEVARNIAKFPQAGRIVPELGEETLREHFVYSYRLLYRIKPERILIVAVIHGRRLMASFGQRFEKL